MVGYPCYSQTPVIRTVFISIDIDRTTIIYPFIIRSLSILTARVIYGLGPGLSFLTHAPVSFPSIKEERVQASVFTLGLGLVWTRVFERYAS